MEDKSQAELPALRDLLHISELSELLEGLAPYKPVYPKAPVRPTKPNRGASSSEYKVYANELEVYEAIVNDEYTPQIELYKARTNQIRTLIEEWIKDHVGLSSVPEQYRNKVWNKAYADYSGAADLLYKLESLVEIFN